MHHPTDRIAHTTAFVTPFVEHWLEREIAQWVHPMKARSDDTSHNEQTPLPRSYISLWGSAKTVVIHCSQHQNTHSYFTNKYQHDNLFKHFNLFFTVSSTDKNHGIISTMHPFQTFIPCTPKVYIKQITLCNQGARCNSVVERPLMAR